MAQDLKLSLVIETHMEQAQAALNSMRAALSGMGDAGKAAGAQTAGAFRETESQFSKTRQGVQSISTVLQRTRSELIAFFSIGASLALTKSLIETADAFVGMNARLKLATQSSAEYTTAQAAIFDISQRTASSLESNITLYARIADSMRAMGKSQQDALVFTESVGQAMRISGASAESAKAGVTQLAQAMASGVLRGDEFNSVMENSPRLAQAMADGLGVPRGALRAMAEEGKLTADKITEALLSEAGTLASEFAQIPLTVGASLTQLSNAWTKYLGEADQAEGATKSLALAISDISKNFNEHANAVLTVGRDALVIISGIGAIKLAGAALEFVALAREARVAGTAIKSIPTSVKIAVAIVGFELLKEAGQWLGEFAAKLVVGDQEVKKFSSGTKLGMEVAAAATALMKKETALLVAEIEHSNGLNAFNQVGESSQDAQARVQAAADGMIKAFDGIVNKSGDVEKALAGMWNSTEFRTPAGLEALFIALDKLKADGKAAGEQIQLSLQGGIDKLDVTQLRSLQMALQASDVAASDMASTLDLVVGTALKKLGTDALAVNDGLSKGFRDAVQTFELLSDNAKATGAEIKFAFDKMLDAAKTKQEAEALKAEFGLLKESGKLSAAEIKDEYARLQAKLNETAGQIDGALGDAFKRMGIKSAEAMKAMAAQMVQDFNDIKNSGTASAEGIDAMYQKIKSSVTASIQAMTTASREALQASKDHTSEVQAGADAIKSQGTALAASANAQKADAEYARASAEALRTGSAAAHEKADALGVAAQAAHAAASAAEADAAASLKAAEAAKAEEEAKKALAYAAANPSEWAQQAAAAAQHFANETARGAEEAKQAAIEAQAVAAEIGAAASAAQALADGLDDAGQSARQTGGAMSAAAVEGTAAATMTAESFSGIVRGAYESAKSAISETKTETDKLIDSAGAGIGRITAFGEAGANAYIVALKKAQAYGRSLAEIEAATRRNEEAIKAWESAMEGLKSTSASLKDELDRALGNDKAIEDRAYADKRRALEDQYKAAKAAALATGDTSAARDAASTYSAAVGDLDKLHKIKLDNIAKESAEKAAADEKSHQDEMARIASEQAAASQAGAVIRRVSAPGYSKPAAREAATQAAIQSGGASSGGETVVFRFVAPGGAQEVSGQFMRRDVQALVDTLKLAGARAVRS